MTKSLAELKAANLPYATLESIDRFIMRTNGGFDLAGVTDEQRTTFGEYLKDFTVSGGGCPACGQSGFTWVIRHGHGACSSCGYPAVAYHYFDDIIGHDIKGCVIVWLYRHPNVLEEAQHVTP